MSYSLVQSILSMTSSSYVTSDQVVLFQINQSCCGDRGLGRWFNAAYTACKFLHIFANNNTSLAKQSTKICGAVINNLQGITNAGLGARGREEYGAIVLSSRPVFVSTSEFLGSLEGTFKMIRMIFGKLHRNKWYIDW